VIPYHIT